MSEKLTPKMELIVTLDKAWEAVQTPTPVNLAILRGLLDHARAVAKRVGNESRTPAKPQGDRNFTVKGRMPKMPMGEGGA